MGCLKPLREASRLALARKLVNWMTTVTTRSKWPKKSGANQGHYWQFKTLTGTMQTQRDSAARPGGTKTYNATTTQLKRYPNDVMLPSSPTGGAYVQKAKNLAILLTPVAVSRPAGVFCFGPVFRGVSPPRHPNPMFSLSQRESGPPNSTTLVRPAPQRQPREPSDSLFDSAKRVNTKERAGARRCLPCLEVPR